MGHKKKYAKVLVTFGFAGLYAAHAIKAWDRPNAKQLLKQQATIWRDAGLIQPALAENSNGGKPAAQPINLLDTPERAQAAAH